MAEQAVSEEKTFTKTKKQLDPRIAFAIMAVMICCALCIGANKAWKEKRQNVDAGYAFLADDLQLRVETAYNLLTVAGRYLPAADPQVAAVKKDLQQMESVSQKAEALNAAVAGGRQFTDDASALLASLAANASVRADSRDAMYVTLMLPQAVEQCSGSAAITAYRTAAESSNSGLRSFSGPLARLTGVKAAPELSAANAGQAGT